jgi:pantoate--beta-alanine ligase
MQLVTNMAELDQALRGRRRPALVPTMGNLHAGHLGLVRRATQLADLVVVSIFVNPLQFGPAEDFESYPRTFEADLAHLHDGGCDIVFAPSQEAFYPRPQTFRVLPDPQIAHDLEGTFRPHFFEGVCTVVLKLLCLVQPSVALFGKKDYQQLAVVRRMVDQFALHVDIEACETVRADDGLALSSRNSYLSAEERREAPELARMLGRLAGQIRPGASSSELSELEAHAASRLITRGWRPDYVSLRRCEDLRRPDRVSCGQYIVLGAAHLGRTRLIDNLEFQLGDRD